MLPRANWSDFSDPWPVPQVVMTPFVLDLMSIKNVATETLFNSSATTTSRRCEKKILFFFSQRDLSFGSSMICPPTVKLSGSLPRVLGDMANLLSFQLKSCALTGLIPTNIGLPLAHLYVEITKIFDSGFIIHRSCSCGPLKKKSSVWQQTFGHCAGTVGSNDTSRCSFK